MFIISTHLTVCLNYISGSTPNVTLFIFALLNLVPLQYVLSNETFYKFALLKLVFSKIEHDKSALGILILFKFIPENDGWYILIAVMAAAELFYIDLFDFD
jgi:hypothetical protein